MSVGLRKVAGRLLPNPEGLVLHMELPRMAQAFSASLFRLRPRPENSFERSQNVAKAPSDAPREADAMERMCPALLPAAEGDAPLHIRTTGGQAPQTRSRLPPMS